MKSKILFSIIFLTFLISSVCALTIDVDYADFSTSKTITNGQSIDIYVDGGSMNPLTLITVKLNSNVIYEESVLSQKILIVHTITPSTYSNTAGTYTIEVTAKDGIESKTKTLSLIVNPVLDTTSPIITLNGANPQNIIVGNAYAELGATATDNLDGDLTSEITITGSVDTNIIGSYTLTYTVLDEAGNTDTETRTVNVVSPSADITAPVITIQSPTQDSTYNLTSLFLNFIASDENLDVCEYSIDNGVTRNPIVCSSDELESIPLTALVGANEWIIYASDVAGNEASASVNFNVDTTLEDTTAPVITIINPEEDETIKSSGLTIQIATDEDVTVTFVLDDKDSKTMNNPEDHIFTYSLSGLSNGEHTIIFTAEDTAGNIATESVTFEVHKKSRGSGSSSLSSIIPKDSITVSGVGNIVGNVIGEEIKLSKDNTSYNILFYALLSTISMGIILTSYGLIKVINKNNK